VLLSLLNWVRTRRLAVVLLLLLGIDIILYLAGGRRYGSSWPYPGFVATMGVVMLLIRLWPHWRLLHRPLPKRMPPRVPPARGLLDGLPWPKGTSRGITTVSVVIGFAMVVVVASAAVSCLSRAAQSSRSAQQSLVATALLHGELERVRAGEVRLTKTKVDLSSRADSLLPSARTEVLVAPRDVSGLFELTMEVSWKDPGGPRHRAAASGLVCLEGQ
jgi:hypothetical protein